MIAFPELLVEPARKAGIKIPDDLVDYVADDYPHWHVYCIMQLGTPMPTFTAHWQNARIIAKIPQDKINLVTADKIIKMGFAIGFSK